MMRTEYDQEYLRKALQHASLSPDPATRVGAVLARPDGGIICGGHNDLPPGIMATCERMSNRDLKLQLIVHAEMSAILCAARLGLPTRGSVVYSAATDDSGEVWGGPPCVRCTVEAIAAGVVGVVSLPRKVVSKWHQNLDQSLLLMREAGVWYREVPLWPELGV